MVFLKQLHKRKIENLVSKIYEHKNINERYFIYYIKAYI